MSGKNRPPLSKAEQEVVRIVWQLRGATVREVFETLPADRRANVEYKTVQTYLRRLEAKGYLKGNKEGRSTRYQACIRPHQVIRENVSDFVSRLFGGDPLPLVEHLISEQKMSQEEIIRIRELIDQKEKKQNESD